MAHAFFRSVAPWRGRQPAAGPGPGWSEPGGQGWI